MTAVAHLFRTRLSRHGRRRRAASLRGEHLEPRALLATFTVSNLLNAGDGSLRWAINQANANSGADDIAFAVPGEISLSSALPAITDTVAINGFTAPGFTGAPAVTVNFRGQTGLRFAPGSDGSSLTSLSLVRASWAGVTLDASDITLAGNFIGVLPDGTTAAGNTGSGVLITARGSGNQIGTTPPITYSPPTTTVAAAGGGTLPVAGWQGLTTAGSPGQYLITGTTTNATSGDTEGLLYVGPITAQGGAGYVMVMPNQPGETTDGTTSYSADNLGDGQLRIVGTYSNAGSATEFGFIFEGTVADVANPANYVVMTSPLPSATEPVWNIPHSTSGGLVVGNYDESGPDGNPLGGGRAYVYDVATGDYRELIYPGSAANTAYGIWHNGGTSYTIAGGWSNSPINNILNPGVPLSEALLVDYDSATGLFSNWKSFSYVPPAGATSVITHFEGISGVQPGIYTLAGTALADGATVAGFASVTRNPDGSFGEMQWIDLEPSDSGTPFADSVYGNAVVGIDPSSGGVGAYQATIVPGGNLISGNGADGVRILGTDNVVERNLIGTDVTGRFAVPNGNNGIRVTSRASGNLIGGTMTGGNDPTNSVFVRPPQGNLISGNRANGVLITGGATATTLSGNFIGTTASGNTALGNAADGVAIVGANGTSLVGTTFQQSPFVFYNVLSGNGGNGLRITNSNNTIVQANITGVGADNATVVANTLSGILVNGSSARTTVGGPIPLGNVNSGNNRYGIEVAGKATGFVAFNSFVGIVAFGGAAPNRLDGIHITATGGNNTIRTCLVAGNYGNGIVIAGKATGVRVEDTATGTNSKIEAAIPNYGSGILITGNAHGNAIGGFQPSVETKVHLSGNYRYGIEITGNARNNTIFNSVIGAGYEAIDPLPNRLGGIYLGSGTRGTVIGGSTPILANRVLFNGGAGITVSGSKGNQILGNEIRANLGSGIVIAGSQSNAIGVAGSGNAIVSNGVNGIEVSGNVKGTVVAANTISGSGSNGLLLNAATNLLVGGTGDGVVNTIVTNVGYGLLAVGSCSRTQVIRNLISGNTQGDVNLAASTGITYVPGVI